MDRVDANVFIHFYRLFQTQTDVKIVDFSDDQIELQFANGNRRWYSDWYAAKVIEAESVPSKGDE